MDKTLPLPALGGPSWPRWLGQMQMMADVGRVPIGSKREPTRCSSGAGRPWQVALGRAWIAEELFEVGIVDWLGAVALRRSA